MDPPCLASRPAKPASGRHGSRIERSLCLTRFTPRSSSGSRMPASQAGDAGSNPARGLEVGEPGVPPPSALGRVWRRGLAVSRVRRVRFPSRALLAVAQWTSTTLLPWPTGVRLLPARLRRKASSEPSGRDPDEQGAIPWRRLVCSRAGIRRADSCRSDPRLRRGRSLKASRFGAATAAERKPHACEGVNDDRPTGEAPL